MKTLPEIEALYLKIEGSLERERTGADEAKTKKIQTQQVLNDQAYYILCWGQLESEIVECCRRAIRSRRSDSDWQVRRSWYLFNPDDKKLSGLSFAEKAALVLDRDAGKGSAWAKTWSHYEARNNIAHGDLRVTRVDVSAFVQDCYLIQAALHRSA